MKRVLCFVTVLLLLVSVCSFGFADNNIVKSDTVHYYNSIRLYGIQNVNGKKENDSVLFGQELVVLENQGEYSHVAYTELWYTGNGQELLVEGKEKEGKFKTGVIVVSEYPLIIFDDVGWPLAMRPGLKKGDFGSASGGRARNTLAIILYETDGYYYVKTSDGLSGFVPADNTHISVYEEQLIVNK